MSVNKYVDLCVSLARYFNGPKGFSDFRDFGEVALAPVALGNTSVAQDVVFSYCGKQRAPVHAPTLLDTRIQRSEAGITYIDTPTQSLDH